MDKIFSELKKRFWIYFSIFAIEALTSSIIKIYMKLPDFITPQSKINTAAMIIMLAGVLFAYYLYDRKAKISKSLENEDENQLIQERLKKFASAITVKMQMFLFIGIFTSLMMILYYKVSYLYILAMIAVFFFISYPSKTRFRQDFIPKHDIFQ